MRLNHLELWKILRFFVRSGLATVMYYFRVLGTLKKPLTKIGRKFYYLEKINSKIGRKTYYLPSKIEFKKWKEILLYMYSQKLCFDNFSAWKESNVLSGFLTNTILNFCQELPYLLAYTMDCDCSKMLNHE